MTSFSIERYAVYSLRVTDEEIIQSKRPIRTCKTLQEAKKIADAFRRINDRPAAVWLEEYINGRWECIESDVYVS
jgi:hypothetical protein